MNIILLVFVALACIAVALGSVGLFVMSVVCGALLWHFDSMMARNQRNHEDEMPDDR